MEQYLLEIEIEGIIFYRPIYVYIYKISENIACIHYYLPGDDSSLNSILEISKFCSIIRTACKSLPGVAESAMEKIFQNIPMYINTRINYNSLPQTRNIPPERTSSLTTWQ